MGSFYAPMVVMVFFNWKIYLTAKKTTKEIRQGFTRIKMDGQDIGGMGIHKGSACTKGRYSRQSSKDPLMTAHRPLAHQMSSASSRSNCSSQNEPNYSRVRMEGETSFSNGSATGYRTRHLTNNTTDEDQFREIDKLGQVQDTHRTGGKCKFHRCLRTRQRSFSERGTQTVITSGYQDKTTQEKTKVKKTNLLVFKSRNALKETSSVPNIVSDEPPSPNSRY